MYYSIQTHINMLQINLHLLIILIFVPQIINSYSKVHKSGSNQSAINTEINSPQTHKLLNIELVFPKMFNATTETAVTEYNQNYENSTSTLNFIGRAATVKSKTFPYHFVNSMNKNNELKSRFVPGIRKYDSYPVYKPSLQPSKAELDKMQGKGEAMDRYTPGEAVASAMFKNKFSGYSYNHQQKQVPQQTPQTQIQPYFYNPPAKSSSQQGLYSFPPNVDINYQANGDDSSKKSKQVISSYLPPPSGPVDMNQGFIGPVSPEYLPSHLQNKPSIDSKQNFNNIMPNLISKDQLNMQNEDLEYDTPPTNLEDIQDDLDHPSHSNSDQEQDDDNIMMPMQVNNDDTKMSAVNSHDNGHSHKSNQSPWNFLLYGGHGIDVYPEIISDHHQIIEHHVTTTEPPPEPRVKKYSYFYLGRKLWYIPLYFTVWFSFYILFLIVKSIARHKVDLPNHYKQRREIIAHKIEKQSFIDDENNLKLTHKETIEQIDRLTAAVMTSIEEFKQKYF